MGRSGEFVHYDEKMRPKRTHRLGAEVWSISNVLGMAGGIVVFLGLLVLAVTSTPGIRDRVVPKAVRDLIERPPASEPETVKRAPVGETVKKVLGVPERGAKSGQRIGLGSTKEEVRAIQGPPTSESDDIWYYGDSEVHFTAGRVVGWRDSSANPLRLR